MSQRERLDIQTVRIVVGRIGLFTLLVMLLNTLDRVNVGFAALTMNSDLGFDPRLFGWAIGLFFVTYIGGQIPMTTLGKRIGLARALPMMVIAWGLIAILMGAINGAAAFVVLRLLLGVAEAAAAPLILYLQSQWIPQQAAGRYSVFTSLAIPVSFVLGAPLSGWLMTAFDGVASLSGWRWMFLIEGAATVLFGLLARMWLPESVHAARWLTESQKDWLSQTLQRDSRADRYASVGIEGHSDIIVTMREGKVWALAACYFCSTIGFYVLLFWLPQVVKDLLHGASPAHVTLISVLPWLGVMGGALLIGWHSDRKNERFGHVAVAALIGAAGMGAFALLGDSVEWAITALVIGGFGAGAAQIVFWTIPMGELRGARHAATAFAFISLLGNVAGLLGSPLIGHLREATQSFATVLVMVAGFLVLEAGILLLLRSHAARRLPVLLSSAESDPIARSRTAP